MRGAIRQIADELTEIRRKKSVLASAEQPADLPQFTVQCPFCQKPNEILMPDRPGETKPTICNVCNSRFNVHMTGAHSVFVGRVPVGVGGNYSSGGPETVWWRFLSDTHMWIERANLANLVSITEAVSGEAETELTAGGLSKRIFLRMDATPSPGLSRSMVRTFIKIIFFGDAFQFPAEIEQPTFQTPFSNKLIQRDLIQAYARGVVRRLRSKFSLTLAELPELMKVLFPPEITLAEESLRQALES